MHGLSPRRNRKRQSLVVTRKKSRLKKLEFEKNLRVSTKNLEVEVVLLAKKLDILRGDYKLLKGNHSISHFQLLEKDVIEKENKALKRSLQEFRSFTSSLTEVVCSINKFEKNVIGALQYKKNANFLWTEALKQAYFALNIPVSAHFPEPKVFEHKLFFQLAEVAAEKRMAAPRLRKTEGIECLQFQTRFQKPTDVDGAVTKWARVDILNIPVEKENFETLFDWIKSASMRNRIEKKAGTGVEFEELTEGLRKLQYPNVPTEHILEMKQTKKLPRFIFPESYSIPFFKEDEEIVDEMIDVDLYLVTGLPECNLDVNLEAHMMRSSSWISLHMVTKGNQAGTCNYTSFVRVKQEKNPQFQNELQSEWTKQFLFKTMGAVATPELSTHIARRFVEAAKSFRLVNKK